MNFLPPSLLLVEICSPLPLSAAVNAENSPLPLLLTDLFSPLASPPTQGHDVTYSKFGSFFCDCGAKEDGSCKVGVSPLQVVPHYYSLVLFALLMWGLQLCVHHYLSSHEFSSLSILVFFSLVFIGIKTHA